MKNFVDNDMRSTRNDDDCPTDEGGVQFRANHHSEALGSDDDDSGFCSPPLWKNSPSPSRSSSEPLLNQHIHRCLSPNARVEAIVRGQRELMEMVKNMHESSYELSLKDLVENHKMVNQFPLQIEGENQNTHGLKLKRRESKKYDKTVMRSESFENKGLLLKMVFPFTLNSKKVRTSGSNCSGKVSPKPEALKGGNERDWWKMKFTGSSDSDSSRTSNNSGSTGSSSSGRSYGSGRKKEGFSNSCWPFLRPRRSKCVE